MYTEPLLNKFNHKSCLPHRQAEVDSMCKRQPGLVFLDNKTYTIQ